MKSMSQIIPNRMEHNAENHQRNSCHFPSPEWPCPRVQQKRAMSHCKWKPMPPHLNHWNVACYRVILVSKKKKALVVSPTAVAYIHIYIIYTYKLYSPFVMFDYMGPIFFSAMFLPMWTRSSPKGVQSTNMAAPVKVANYKPHRNHPEPSTPTFRNLPLEPEPASTHRNPPEPSKTFRIFRNLPQLASGI